MDWSNIFATTTSWLWLILGTTVLTAWLYGVWWLWWQMPKRQAARLGLNDPKAQADVEDNFRKTIGQLIGGGAVLVGAAIAYMQFQQQQRASRDLLISNQISKLRAVGQQRPAAESRRYLHFGRCHEHVGAVSPASP
jgi:hypothetical protein